MLDIKLIRHDPAAVKAAIARRGEDASSIDQVVEFDLEVRAHMVAVDEIREESNRVSKEIGELFRSGERDKAEDLKKTTEGSKESEREHADSITSLQDQIRTLLLNVSNMPSPEAPDGLTEDDNIEVRVEDFDPASYADHQKIPHWEIGEELGILDVDRAVRMSGSMFAMYRGHGAHLLRALISYGLDRNRDAFEEVRPPTMVKTAEVPLTSMVAGEILDEAELPMRLMAHTSCYRREAGSAGRDTRGLLRVHEFDKVELYSFCTPDQAQDMHMEILGRAESAIRDLGLAHRVLDLACGDISGAGARTYDIEIFAPGADRWLEVSSVSWCTDYQARRANIRYRPEGQKGIVETYRQANGSIKMPEVLLPYLNGMTEIPGPS
ncbi:MAG: serine--tRNA ligase [Acidimicrobiales bacterium]